MSEQTKEKVEEEDRLARYRDDLAGAERQASKTVNLGRAPLWMAIGLVGFFVSLFLPHSGEVIGLDVLFFSDTAQKFVTTVPERIYVWLGVIGVVLLNIGTLVSRSTLIALLAWFFSGATFFYSIFAIWMRQSRPPTEPGVGPSYGLIIGAVSVFIAALAYSTVVFSKSKLQKALAQARIVEKKKDSVAEVQETILAMNRDTELVDDRRSRRRKSKAENKPEQQQDAETSK